MILILKRWAKLGRKMQRKTPDYPFIERIIWGIWVAYIIF